MRVVVSIKATSGGGHASQAACYIVHRDRDEVRKGTKPRPLFSAQENTLSFWQAERTLTEGFTPAKDEVAHLAVSLKAEDFQALGRDETTVQQSLKEVTREALAEIVPELDPEALRWVAGGITISNIRICICSFTKIMWRAQRGYRGASIACRKARSPLEG